MFGATLLSWLYPAWIWLGGMLLMSGSSPCSQAISSGLLRSLAGFEEASRIWYRPAWVVAAVQALIVSPEGTRTAVLTPRATHCEKPSHDGWASTPIGKKLVRLIVGTSRV